MNISNYVEDLNKICVIVFDIEDDMLVLSEEGSYLIDT